MATYQVSDHFPRNAITPMKRVGQTAPSKPITAMTAPKTKIAVETADIMSLSA